MEDNNPESLKTQFSNLGFLVSDSVLDKCVELCVLYNVDEEMFVETWTAYSITNLDGGAPTVETLLQMERKEFRNRDKSTNISFSHNSVSPHSVQKNSSFNKIETGLRKNDQDKITQEDDNIIHGQNNDPPLGQKICTNESSFSSSCFSTIQGNHGVVYPAGSRYGRVVAEVLQEGSGDWTATFEILLNIYPYNDHNLPSSCKLMREPLSKKADVLNNTIEHIGKCLIKRNCLPEPACNNQISPTEVVCLGRICCDSNEHLNFSSVMLEGSRNLSLGQCVALDLSRLSHYALFPGQIVAVVGTNLTGQRFLVKKLYCSAPLPLSPYLPTFQDAIQIVIAAGPFTQEGLLSEPLEKLITYVENYRPHILILIGPLVYLKHVQYINGTNIETYSNAFNKIVDRIMDGLKGSWTQVILVSSTNDAACLPVYPTPTLTCNSNYTSLHCVSDPCLLSVNGMVIGLTATDSLLHLEKEEISHPNGSKDRLGRIASHLLDQQSFYPLYPPSDNITIDSDMWDCYANFEVTPHLLIIPSDFRYFIKELHGCLLVNPGQLVKRLIARLEVQPPSDNTWTPSTHISAQILEM